MSIALNQLGHHLVRPVSALILASITMLIVLPGCDLWVKGPEGRLFQVTLPDQEVLDFLNGFNAGLVELSPLVMSLEEPRLVALLQAVEAAFRRLERAVEMGSPAQPVDPTELQRALAALIRALEPEGLPADGLRLSQREAALAEASRLQGLVDGLASRLSPQPPEPKLDPPPSGPNAGKREPSLPPGCVFWYWHEASAGSISRMALPEEELAAFTTRFTAIISQMRLVLNAMNAPQLGRLLDQVEAAFQKMQRAIRSSSPISPADPSELRLRLAAFNQAVAQYPCHGSRSRSFLEQGEELEALLEAFVLAARQGGQDRHCVEADLGQDGLRDRNSPRPLRAEIAGGDRTVCLGDPRFSGLGSTGPIVQYYWDFGDGQTASGPTVSHEYRRPGKYKVTLTVVDREGHTARASILVVVRYC
jgi:hypothetical protein